MTKLSIAVIGTTPSNSESILSQRESSAYSPGIFDTIIEDMINQIPSFNFTDYQDIQVSVSLTANDSEVIRPSISLSKETIKKLANINASFDFDPYV